MTYPRKRNWPAEQARARCWLGECYRILAKRTGRYTQLELRLGKPAERRSPPA